MREVSALSYDGRTRSPVRPSPAFLVVVAATALGGWLCVTGAVDPGIAVFVFVFAGWILSLIFHEFAHAVVAWRGGDRSIPAKGYLTLDPRRYADPLTSMILPLIFLVAGGIGLPGGAVWINRAALRSRVTASLVSLAGPATNLVFAAACLIPISINLVRPGDHPVFAAALGFLGFLQVVAFVLNLLPVPGLDGFGALEPFLPRSVLAAVAPLRAWGMFVLIAVLFYVDPVRDGFWDVIEGVAGVFGVDHTIADEDLVRTGFDPELGPGRWPLRSAGWRLFRFWE